MHFFHVVYFYAFIGMLFACVQLFNADFSEVQVRQWFGEVWSNVPAMESATMVFVGDVFLGRAVERMWLTDEAKQPFVYVQEYLQSADVVVGNFESSIPKTHVPTPDFGFQFSTRAEFLPVLHAAGFTHLSVANNHSLDFGLSAFANTKTVINDAGMQPVGSYKIGDQSVTIVEHQDNTIALISFDSVQHEYSFEALQLLISAIPKVDFLVAYVHWGGEYVAIPSEFQKTIARDLASLDIDLVVGHHPHVIQSVELIDDTIVFYSLGNFVFDQYFSEAVQTGLMLELTYATPKQISIIPVNSIATPHQPQILVGDARDSVLTDLSTISSKSLQEAIELGTITLQ